MGYEIGDEELDFIGADDAFDMTYEIGDDDLDWDDEDELDEEEELAALLGARRRRPVSRKRTARLRSRKGRSSSRRAALMRNAMATAEAVKRVEGGTLLRKTAPTKSREFPIGFDSVGTIAAGATATLTQRPQIIFRPERIVVPAAVAAFFQINDVKVGKNSQLVSSGAIPAATFSETAFGVRLKLDTVQVSQDLILIVVNIDVAARRFLAAIIGESVE